MRIMPLYDFSLFQVEVWSRYMFEIVWLGGRSHEGIECKRGYLRIRKLAFQWYF
jgi:hypothetical protein